MPEGSNGNLDDSSWDEPMSLESIALGALALVFLGVGYVFVFRVETALRFQRRYAEAVSRKPPSENPEYYESTCELRKGVFSLADQSRSQSGSACSE